MGALYLASKLEECPVRMRDLINVFDLLLARAKHTLQKDHQVSNLTLLKPNRTLTATLAISLHSYGLF